MLTDLPGSCETLPASHDPPEVVLADAGGNGGEVIDRREVDSGVFKGGDEERAITGGAASGALVSRDETLIPAEATEEVLQVVVGLGQIGHVVARKDLLAEVVGGAQHVIESAAPDRRSNVRREGADVVEDGSDGGGDAGAAGAASQDAGNPADDAVEELDVVGLLLRGLYGMTEVLGELLKEQGALFFSASWSVCAV